MKVSFFIEACGRILFAMSSLKSEYWDTRFEIERPDFFGYLEKPSRRWILYKMILFFAILFLSVQISWGQTSVNNFNSAGQLTDFFNGSGTHVSNVVQATDGGLNNSGSVSVPSAVTNAVFTSKNSYSLGPVGSSYSFQTFIKSTGPNGYSGVGFTAVSPTSSFNSTPVYRPNDALGVSVHGGGYEFHNGPTNYSGQWGVTYNSTITTVKVAACSNLIDNTTLSCGSPDRWYKIIFKITRASSTTFDMRVEVWPAEEDGTLLSPTEASAIVEVNGVTNSTLSTASQLHSYFNFSGHRVTKFDDFSYDLEGSTEIEAGAPVVLTESVSLINNIISVSGNVTSDNGDAVTERGFVYSLFENPTIDGSKIVIGSGSGSFSGESSELTSANYYVRAFATNSIGTSYGEEFMLIGNQSPSDLSLDQQTILDGAASNSLIGSFTTYDSDDGDSFIYSLVAGDGDVDNADFLIDGDELIILESPDFAVKSSYSVRVRTTDQGGGVFEKIFSISVIEPDTTDPILILGADATKGTDEDDCFYTIQGTEFDPLTATDNSGSLASLTYSLKKLLPSPSLISENFNTGAWNPSNFEIGSATGSVVNNAYRSANGDNRGTLRTVSDFRPTAVNPVYVSATLRFSGTALAFIGTRATGLKNPSASNEPLNALYFRIHNFNNGQTNLTSTSFDGRPGNSFYSNPIRVAFVDNGTNITGTFTNTVTNQVLSFNQNTSYSSGSWRVVFSGGTGVSWDDIKISFGPHESIQEFESGSNSLAGVEFDPGETTVEWTAIDNAGNSVTDSFVVTVADTQAPSLTVGESVEQLPESGTALTLTIPDAVFSDNCSDPVLTWRMSGVHSNSGTGQIGTFNFNPGTTKITYTVTDSSGNTKIDSLNITNTYQYFYGGSGTEIDPYQISDWGHLSNIRYFNNKYFVLINDLDDSSSGYETYASSTANSGAGWSPISYGRIYFDGKGFTISDLNIKRTNNWELGIFGYVYNSSFKNIRISDFQIEGGGYIGSIAGYAENTVFDNIQIANGSIIASSYYGGLLVGGGYNLTILNSSVEGEISGGYYLGGFLGELYDGKIEDSYANITISGIESIGGLVGYYYVWSPEYLINRSYAKGTVSGVSFLGGLVGQTYEGKIQNSYSQIHVDGTGNYLGGIIGYGSTSDLLNIYVTGVVDGPGEYVDVLIGQSDSDVLTGIFWDIETSGISESAVGGIGKTTAEMKTQSTFTDWDFEDDWAINPTGYISYPYFQTVSYDELGVSPAVNPIPGLEFIVIPPTLTDGNISISGATGTGGVFKIGDTVTVTWDNTAEGDNNTNAISSVTVDFSQFGGGSAVEATNNSDTWTAAYSLTAGIIDAANRNVSVTVTDSASEVTTTDDTTNASVDNDAPVVSNANISISGATGTGGVFKIGDTVTATWNNTAEGDNNSDVISSVTVDFSQFGGGAAVAATNSSGTWTATYTITAGTIDATDLNVSVTATDNAGNTTTTADTTNATLDNGALTITNANISISGATGTGGVFKIGDTVTATWNNTAEGDNNSDVISSVTVDFSQFGGGAAVAATNSSGTWTATYTITAGTIDATDLNVSVTATDNAGNTTTTADTTNATVDNVAPVFTSFTPAHQSIEIALQPVLTMTFDQEVVLGNSGVLKLDKLGEDGCTIEPFLEFNLSDSEDKSSFVLSEDNLTVSLAINENLPANTLVLVEIPSGFAADLQGNDFKGFNASSYTWTFTTVDKNNQTITFPEIEEKTYGDVEFTLGDALTDQGLTVTYTAVDPTVVSITGNQATILKAGSTTITATQAGDDENFAAEPVDRTLTVGKKGLTITAIDKTKVYGEANPTLTFTYQGLVNGDTKAATEPSISTAATQSSGVGTYPIQLTGAADTNYSITLVEGELEVNQAALTITAADKTKVYGQENPELLFSYTGLVNGDEKVSTEPSIATTASLNSGVGTYPINLTGGSDLNYAITLVNGSLTVSKATLKIQANPQTKIFGSSDPELDFIATGFKGMDNLSLLTGKLIREIGEQIGVYTIGLGTLKPSNNYELEFSSAQFQIIPAQLIAISDPNPITTPWAVSPNLPMSLSAVTADGQVVTLAVTWNQTPLNVFKRGTYFLPGEVTLPSGILNTEELKATLEVKVQAKPAPQDVLLNNNVFDPDPKNYFQVIGNFTVVDPIDNEHLITLVPGEGDNHHFEVKQGILFWSSADEASGKTQFTIVIQVEDRDGNMMEKSFTINRGRTDINELEVFNSFTPNGDGINDTWGVPDLRYFKGVRVQVFDRNGERVFYTEDADTRWDGTYKGKEMPVGTYFWIVEVIETGNVRKGVLTILKN